MQKKAEENVFFSHKNLWCCHTPVVNFNAKTIEHRTRTGFLTRDNAEKAYEKASRLFPKELAKLKASSPCPFTFTEYLKHWYEKLYVPVSTSGSTKVKYHWIIYHIILPRVTADPLLPYVDAEYIENLIESCRNYCASAEYAVYKLLYRILYSAWNQGFLETCLASDITERKETKSSLRIYTKEQLKLFLNAIHEDPYAHRLEFLLALFCGLRPGDDDDKIRLNQRKPSKYKGLRRFGPEKNLQRINKFMKERPIFYKNLIQMKENIRFYLRCFYCITKVLILQFNSENRTELARNG